MGWLPRHAQARTAEGARRVALSLGFVSLLAACGSQSAAYSGHLYSVTQVRSAFASLGFRLIPNRRDGQVVLRNDPRPNPTNSNQNRDPLTVVVITRRHAAESPVSLESGRLRRVMRYANVTVFAERGWPLGDEVKGAVSALRWGTASPEKSGKRLIVPGASIGGIRLGESRGEVVKVLGRGEPARLGAVKYFGGRLLVGYEFHDRIYGSVTYVEARSGRYRLAGSGVHVGSSRADLRRLYVTCYRRTVCNVLAGPWPDPLGTWFTVRHGKVAEIGVGRLA